jgi:hypothetical protein
MWKSRRRIVHQIAFGRHPEKPDTPILAVNGLPFRTFEKLQIATSGSGYCDPPGSLNPRSNDLLEVIGLVWKREK